MIKNANVTNYETGIKFEATRHSTITDSYLGSNSHEGIYLYFNSENNTIKNNSIASNTYGIFTYLYADENNITGNSFVSNIEGIEIYDSENNVIENNYFESNDQVGVYISYANNTLVRGNLVDGYKTTGGSVTGVRIDRGYNNTVTNNVINKTYIPGYGVTTGILLERSSGNNISGNIIENVSCGGNSCASYGIRLKNATGNILDNNSLRAIKVDIIIYRGYAIYFEEFSANNNFTDFLISDSEIGIVINGSTNLFEGGTINNTQKDAIIIWKAQSDNNIFREVNIINTGYNDSRLEDGVNGTKFIDTLVGDYYISSTGSIIVLENTTFGEIRFIKPVTGSASSLSGTVYLGNNSAVIDASANSGLDKAANITLYGIGDRGFTNPVILDGVSLCSDCYNFTSLEAETVAFNVTGAGNYSVGESS